MPEAPYPSRSPEQALLRVLAAGAARGRDWFEPDDGELSGLIEQIADRDPLWLLRCIGWLRAVPGLGPAAIVLTADLVHARLKTGATDNRKLIRAVLKHAHEPGRLLLYWSETYGRPVPKPVQRGVADAVKILYTPQSAAEHDHPGRGLRFGEVLTIARPKPDNQHQADLFRTLIDTRSHSPDTPAPDLTEPAVDPAVIKTLEHSAATGRAPFDVALDSSSRQR
ncbi:hypothetical protein [Actinomadura rudentiformis]|uniref:TROVE domain-containing protein n=1 Tax=Actinomadura rudentiformis TaxID=359158 RepID=A0A6H9Y7Z8_9ACTN|nr:hypothetical protein [Actinomadura rudentiformis]KAB2340128.1 hypothetical protein F8566_45480 [Actinomadura rudentiformis]